MNEEIKINQGFVYHIKDSYFEFAQDNMLIFTDIDRLEKLMLDEIAECN